MLSFSCRNLLLRQGQVKPPQAAAYVTRDGRANMHKNTVVSQVPVPLTHVPLTLPLATDGPISQPVR